MRDKTALYWDKRGDKIFCGLCPQECVIGDGMSGLCGARQNLKDRLVSKSYGILSAVNIDPVEKKPLYHFYPGSKTLSFGSFGCNLKCRFCQNFSISFSEPAGDIRLTPREALSFAYEKNIKLISYTYNEPLTNYEWVFEMSELAGKNGISNILVTNGYINEKPLKKLAKYIDAANIDLKAFDDDFYKRICGGTLLPVLKTIELLAELKVHTEITNLVIDGENEDEGNFFGLVNFIAGISDEIPLHLSRCFSNKNFAVARTRKETLMKFYNTAKSKLKYVYLANSDSPEHGTTYCGNCSFPIIERIGYDVKINCENPGICPKCAAENNIIA